MLASSHPSRRVTSPSMTHPCEVQDVQDIVGGGNCLQNPMQCSISMVALYRTVALVAVLVCLSQVDAASVCRRFLGPVSSLLCRWRDPGVRDARECGRWSRAVRPPLPLLGASHAAALAQLSGAAAHAGLRRLCSKGKYLRCDFAPADSAFVRACVCVRG